MTFLRVIVIVTLGLSALAIGVHEAVIPCVTAFVIALVTEAVSTVLERKKSDVVAEIRADFEKLKLRVENITANQPRR